MCDVYEDNQAAIRFVQGQTLTERTRHIHREDSAIRELQRNKEINIQYINTPVRVRQEAGCERRARWPRLHVG